MKPNKIVRAYLLVGLVSLVTACGANDDGSAELSPEEARGIAKEAYVYGFPLVDGDRPKCVYRNVLDSERIESSVVFLNDFKLINGILLR